MSDELKVLKKKKEGKIRTFYIDYISNQDFVYIMNDQLVCLLFDKNGK